MLRRLTTCRTMLVAATISICVIFTLINGACAGADPAGAALASGLDSGFRAIKADAELGIRVRATPELADAARVPRISAEAAEFANETIAYHQRLIELSHQRAVGTVDPNAQLPRGPTRNHRVR